MRISEMEKIIYFLEEISRSFFENNLFIYS